MKCGSVSTLSKKVIYGRLSSSFEGRVKVTVTPFAVRN